MKHKNIPINAAPPRPKPMENIENIIAIASGKGGVGKSTVAVNLALALAKEAHSVGLLDADIYGPSQPKMLGIHEKPVITQEKRFKPIHAHGLQTMSIGYLIDVETPMIWRGPMVSKALQQLIFDTDWEPLDYLIIDLPPGTGDIQLTLSQKIPVTKAIVVTTPQDIALIDARKGLEMFKKVDIPVAGIIENMSVYTCPECGHQAHIFGKSGGNRIAEATDTPLLGSIPLDLELCQQMDNATPPLIANPTGPIAQTYTKIAKKLSTEG